MRGRINSFQSMGAVDGPGIRYVVFMQGCPLRCIYCHNPETWSMEGSEYSVDAVLHRILRCRPYFGKDGGVTVSGGEPLLQGEFVTELFRRLKEAGIHTALDTSGIGRGKGIEKLLGYTDLLLCDLKFSSEKEYHQYCGGNLEQVLSFLKHTEKKGIPLWIRHIVVPGLTDGEPELTRVMKLAEGYSNLRRFELLPFKKLCITKYEALGIPFPLADCAECQDAEIDLMHPNNCDILV